MSSLDSNIFERIGLETTKFLQNNEEREYEAHLARVVSHRSHLVVCSLLSYQQLYANNPLAYRFLASTSRGLIDSSGVPFESEIEIRKLREMIKKPEVAKKFKLEVDILDPVLRYELELEDLWYLTHRTNQNIINVFAPEDDINFFRYYNLVLKNYGAKNILFQLEGGRKSFSELRQEPTYGRTILALDGLERLNLIKGNSSGSPEIIQQKRMRDPLAVYLDKTYEMIKQRDVSGAITVNQRILDDAQRLALYDDISRILSLKGELAKVRRYISEVNKMSGTQTKQEETLNTKETAIEKVRRLSKKNWTPTEFEQIKTAKSLATPAKEKHRD
jgi:hypothetical protein